MSYNRRFDSGPGVGAVVLFFLLYLGFLAAVLAGAVFIVKVVWS